MSIFSRKSSAGRSQFPAFVLNQLGAFGEASLEARRQGMPVTDPRFDWENFFSAAMPALDAGRDQAIGEIRSAAGNDPIAMFGGSQLVAEYDASLQDPRYLEMLDTSLQLLRSQGFPSARLTGYEADRWIATHGDLSSF